MRINTAVGMARRLIGCGRAAQGNEFSYQMLLASNYVLNAVTEPESCAIRPFIDCPNNHTTRASMLAPVRIHRAVRALAPVCGVFGSRNRIGDPTRCLEFLAPLSHKNNWRFPFKVPKMVPISSNAAYSG